MKSASDKLSYYAYSTIKAPDKGEVGGSSPPRPTIKIINKYAAIHVFPSKGELSSKTILPKFAKTSRRKSRLFSGAFRHGATRMNMLRELGPPKCLDSKNNRLERLASRHNGWTLTMQHPTMYPFVDSGV